MDIDKKSRDALKSRFKKNAIPTAGDFADLIDAAVNQKEDGIVKPRKDEPLSVEALPDGNKPVLKLYESFADAAPAWALSLQDSNASGAREALVVSDGDGRVRLSIDRETGELTAAGAINAKSGVTVPAEGALTSAGRVVTADLRVTGSQTWLTGVDATGHHWLVAGQPEGINLPGQGPTALGFKPAEKRIAVSPGASLSGSGGPLKVAGDATIAGALQVHGGTSGQSALQVFGHALVENGLQVAEGAAVDTLQVGGGLDVGSDINLGGAIATRGPVELRTRTGVRLDATVPQYLSLPDLPEKLFGEAALVVQAWVYLYSFEGPTVLFCLNGPMGSRLCLIIDSGGAMRLVSQAGAKVFAFISKPKLDPERSIVRVKEWTHLAAAFNKGQSFMVYKNGVPIEKEILQVPDPPPALPNCLGRGLNGVIAEASLWNAAGKTVTLSSLGGNEPGLLGYWRLNGSDDIGPMTIRDSCTNTPHVGNATLVGGSAVVADSPAGIKQEKWTPPAMVNGWVAYGSGYNPPGYFKDSCGVVRLRGLVKGGAIGTVIFALPAGYRPEYRELFIACTEPNAAGRVDVTPSGQVIAVGGNPNWISLDGLSFRAHR